MATAKKIGQVARQKGTLVWVNGEGEVFEKIIKKDKYDKNLPSQMDGVKKKKGKKGK
ncbi:MAG: hypothetical protein OHK0038_20400 [Flammeovirgaceae bacterium]